MHCWTHFAWKYCVTQITQGWASPRRRKRWPWGGELGTGSKAFHKSPVWNNQSSSSPGAWDDPQWKGKLLLEHRPQRSRLYRALTRCHKQGQCCPLPHTSSTSTSSGPPDRKRPYENSRKEFKKKTKQTNKKKTKRHTRVADPPLKTEMAV